MAIFQGARLRNVSLPAQTAVRPRGHARVSAPVRQRAPATRSSGVRPMGILIAGILVATMVGLAYLTQTLGSNTTSAQIGDLTSKSNNLADQLRLQKSNVELATDASAIAKRARELGLKPLGEPLVLSVP